MDDRVWRLPGPQSFVADIVAEHGRGRHVAVVLPKELAASADFTDGLAVALLDEFASRFEAQRVYDPGAGRPVLAAFADALVMGEPPATVPDLLQHEETRDKVAVVVAADLSGTARAELPRFLHRVELESHAGGYARRLSVVAVVSRDELPAFPGGTTSDITLTSIWWWGRIARWDVAAYIAGLGVSRGAAGTGVLSDVRAESIVEVARWDLDLAERLANRWDGDPAELPGLLGDCVPRPSADRGGSPPKGTWTRGTWDDLRPPASLLDRWDERRFDRWHEQPSGSGYSLAMSPGGLPRAVWAAQARVLLPWVEERRSLLLHRVKQTLGNQRFAQVLRSGFEPPVKPDASVEIGVLDRLVQLTIGSSDPELGEISRHLRQARNLLAHMTPLTLAQQEALVSAGKALLTLTRRLPARPVGLTHYRNQDQEQRRLYHWAMTAEQEAPRVVSASREIAASPERIFELIADPSQQPRWDGNDNLVEARPGQRVRQVGDVFIMTIHAGSVRENHVVEFEEGRRIAWHPSEVGRRQPGHLWRWELTPLGDSRTLVTHTYDWTLLTDKNRLPRAKATTSERLSASLDRLATLAETS